MSINLYQLSIIPHQIDLTTCMLSVALPIVTRSSGMRHVSPGPNGVSDMVAKRIHRVHSTLY